MWRIPMIIARTRECRHVFLAILSFGNVVCNSLIIRIFVVLARGKEQRSTDGYYFSENLRRLYRQRRMRATESREPVEGEAAAKHIIHATSSSGKIPYSRYLLWKESYRSTYTTSFCYSKHASSTVQLPGQGLVGISQRKWRRRTLPTCPRRSQRSTPR